MLAFVVDSYVVFGYSRLIVTIVLATTTIVSIVLDR
jgi:hypothetical protein